MRLALLLVLLLATPAHAQLVASVLPPMRTVLVGQPASAFATVINAGATTAHGCGIELMGTRPATFRYQTTDPGTNQVTGTPNTPVDILAGSAQSFVVVVTPTAAFSAVLSFRFACTDVPPADITFDVNTLWLFGVTSPRPDIIAIAVTPTNDGVVNIPVAGTGVVAIAAKNIGATEWPACQPGTCSCTAWVGMRSSVPTIRAKMCETNPITGACLSMQVTIGPGITEGLHRSLAADETATFTVFVESSAPVEFSPAANRLTISFDSYNCFSHSIHGATHVAVRTLP
jgi:hypothetical protein